MNESSWDSEREAERRLLQDIALALGMPIAAIDYAAHANSGPTRRQYGFFVRYADGRERFLANGFSESAVKLGNPQAAPKPGISFDFEAERLLARLGFRRKTGDGH